MTDAGTSWQQFHVLLAQHGAIIAIYILLGECIQEFYFARACKVTLSRVTNVNLVANAALTLIINATSNGCSAGHDVRRTYVV